jgi:wyosine [tRNA(Phe)-imidazoG37] synthetase (radical SAM superfamily)
LVFYCLENSHDRSKVRLIEFRSIELLLDRSTLYRANAFSIDRKSIDRIDTRSIDFVGHSESAVTAETEPGTQKLFFFEREQRQNNKYMKEKSI